MAHTEIANVAELDPQIAALKQQHTDLMAIRGEIATELATSDPRDGHRLRNLTVSILIIDGRFNIEHEAIPPPLPLFEQLKARGYTGPARAPWNPMAALFGSLPSIERRPAELQKQRDEAQAKLDSVLHD